MSFYQENPETSNDSGVGGEGDEGTGGEVDERVEGEGGERKSGGVWRGRMKRGSQVCQRISASKTKFWQKTVTFII